jgi:hypothetical protein
LDDNGNKLPVSGKDGQNGADGKDGQDGADGKDGISPLLKIENGYWYISYDNGATWTESGKATGDNGQNGQNGTDGKGGQDGVTPLLKIENGYWYISYDNGATWAQLGKATGEDGKDGADGTNGTDGITPQLKIENGYCYVSYDNGATWKQFGKATGADGQDGQNGTDGKDGQDGKDGVTPQLKIEEGYWFISYDNGATWTQLGKATGENGKDGKDGADGEDGQNGTDGKDGQDGDSMFQSVTQDENYVYFTLADGTVIKIAKGNNTNGQPNGDAYIDFEDFNVLKALLNMGVDINNDCYITYNEAANVDSLIFTNNTSIYFFREFKYFTGIQYFMFNKCSNLFAINLPEHIKYIDNECFLDCINLKHIQIPESCIKIGDRAFAKCSTLETVNVSTNCTSMGNSAFNSCTNLNNINIPESCIRIGDSIFNGCKSIKNIYIPESCSRIGAYAFNECSSLLGISLPSSVTRIEKYTFNNCSSLKKIDIPNSVYYIAATALTGLGVDTLTFPENYGSELMFDLKNPNLKTIVWNTIAFPTDYHYRDDSGYYHIYDYWGIGGYWKYGNHTNMMYPTYETGVYNSTISTIVFGENVESLPASLCYQMSSLKTIYSKNILPPTFNNGIVGCNYIQTIYVPMESVEKYKASWAQFADKIVGYDFE